MNHSTDMRRIDPVHFLHLITNPLASIQNRNEEQEREKRGKQ